MLKSKNFSASRLLTSKGMMGDSQNSRKGSMMQKQGSVSVEKDRGVEKNEGSRLKLKINGEGKPQKSRIVEQKTPVYDE